MGKLLHYLSALVFLAMAAVHGARYMQGFDIVVAGEAIPMEVSMVGGILFAVLCLNSFAAARRL
jgi:hypothetical protein